MAVSGTPMEGRDNIIAVNVYTGLDLRAYTNTANSLDSSTVFADLSEPSGSGYAAISLDGAFSSTNGVVTYDAGTPDDERWTAGDNWTGGDVVGTAITDGTYVLHFKDLSEGPVSMTTDKVLVVDISTII